MKRSEGSRPVVTFGVALAVMLLTVLALGAASAAALSFAPARQFSAGPGPAALATADLNGDGKLDLVVADSYGYSLRLFMGNGRGGFATGAGPYATGAGPGSVAVADFNGDAKPDVVTASEIDGTVSVLLGDGLGGFTSRVDFVIGTPTLGAGLFLTGVAVGDFDADGHKDLAVESNNDIGVLLGDGAGGFAPFVAVPAPPGASHSVAVGDFNDDGNQDLATAFNEWDVARGAGVVLGDGLGHFSDMTVYDTYTEPYAIDVGDLNGDHRQDLVTTETLDGVFALVVLLGNGDGSFARAPGSPKIVTNDQGNRESSGPALGDIDGDGRQDVVTALGTNVIVLRGGGRGGLATPKAFPVGAHPLDIVVADFNRDGLLDLATANWAENSVSVLLNGPREVPVLDGLTPRQGGIGTVITLTGAHFGATRGAGVVRFGGVTAVKYVSWSSTEIKVRVPAATATGWVRVTVSTVAGRSEARAFRRL